MKKTTEKKENRMKRIVSLSNPITWEGKKIEKIEINFENVTGKTVIEAQTLYKAEHVELPRGLEDDFEYIGIMSEILSGQDKAMIESLSYVDYMEVIRTVQYFLIFGKLAQ